MHIYTVLDAAYMRLGLAWGRQVLKVSGRRPTFVCADAESQALLAGHGFPTRLRPPPRPLDTSGRVLWRHSSFPTDAAAYIVSLKLEVAAEHLARGEAVLFSDVDAIWLRDPVDELRRTEADLVVQAGSFPPEAKQAWGFAACTGFFVLRPGAATARLVDLCLAGFDGSDQRTLNRMLLEHFDVTWAGRPQGWESAGRDGGWVETLPGTCAATGLRLAALSPAFYQRHGTTPQACAHAVVCHPNSPKDLAGKLAVLAELGIDLGPV